MKNYDNVPKTIKCIKHHPKITKIEQHRLKSEDYSDGKWHESYFPASKETQEIADQVSYIITLKWYNTYCYLTLHRWNSLLNKKFLKCFQCIKLWHIVCHHLYCLHLWMHAIISRYFNFLCNLQLKQNLIFLMILASPLLITVYTHCGGRVEINLFFALGWNSCRETMLSYCCACVTEGGRTTFTLVAYQPEVELYAPLGKIHVFDGLLRPLWLMIWTITCYNFCL